MDPKYHLEEQHQQLCTHDLFAQILYSHNFYIRLLHMFMYGNIQQSKTMKVNKNLVYTDHTHTHTLTMKARSERYYCVWSSKCITT